MKHQEFKTIRAHNINWLKNASANGGAQNMIIDSMQQGRLAITAQHNKYGRLYADVSPSEFLKLIKNNIYICEIISDKHYPHKLYFDIDGTTETTQTNIQKELEKLFVSPDMAISGSETDTKNSYHICLNNYMIYNKEGSEKMKLIIDYLKEFVEPATDRKVYNKSQLMKTIHQSKPLDKGKRLQEIILNENEEKHIITSFFKEDAIDINDVKFNDEITSYISIKELNKKIDMGNEPKLNIQLDIKTLECIDNLKALELLNIAPLTKEHTHKYTFQVMLFCYTNSISFDSYMKWYMKKNNSEEKKNNKFIQWQTLHQYKGVEMRNFKNLLSYYYPELKTGFGAIKFNQLINTTAFNNVKYIDRIEPINFIESSKYKFTTFFMGMGCGKTEQMLMFLKTQPTKRFLFIIPNISLGIGVYKRIQEFGIKVEHYDEDYRTKNKKYKNKHEMSTADNLIICINSLHYLKQNRYDYIIIDEIETVNNKWFQNKTLTTTDDVKLLSCESWDIYKQLLKKAERVFLLDAFITNTTLKFIDGIEPNNYIIFKKPVEISDRKMIIIPKKKTWLNKIIEELKMDKKIFIFYPHKDGNKANYKMEELKQIIERATNKTGVAYNADTDDKVLIDLKNVNEKWVNYQFVITNSKITVGINYDDTVNIFDSVFISIASFSSCRDVIQASCRPRNLSSNNIYVNFLDGKNSNINFTNDDSLIKKGDDIEYFKMVQNVQIEKLAPLKSTFYSFCKMAGYKVSTQELLDIADNDINELLETIDVSYKTIQNITTLRANEILDKMTEHTATTYEKIELRKYFFKKLFIDEESEEIEEAWDNKFNTFFTQLNSIVPNLTNNDIFEKIRIYNGWSSIVPDNKQLNKVKLSEELIENIFETEGWVFSRLTKKSGAKIILKHIYNTYFNKTIIKGLQANARHSFLEFDEQVVDMYNFGIRNLRAYNLERIKNCPSLNVDIFED